MLKTGVVPSASVAVTVVTTVVFSSTVTAAVLPPPWLVITGASLTLATVSMNSSLAAKSSGSTAVTRSTTLPTSAWPGVPLSVCVAAFKLSQAGSAVLGAMLGTVVASNCRLSPSGSV